MSAVSSSIGTGTGCYSNDMYLHACMHVCTYVRTYVCMFAIVIRHVSACMHVRTYVCMHVCMYVCTYIHMYHIYPNRSPDVHFLMIIDQALILLFIINWLFSTTE